MSGTSPSVSKIARKKGASDATVAGQLDRFDDGWEFTGNGKTSPKDVAESIIEYEKKQNQGQEQGQDKDKESQDDKEATTRFDQVRPEVLAKMLLESPENSALNTHLAGDINRAVPAPGPGLSVGQTTFRAETTSLKRIVQLLMQHEQQLRAGLTVPDKTGEANRLTGNVAANGLILPYEPS